MQHWIKHLGLIIVFISQSALAQNSAEKNSYISTTDQKLTLHSMAVLPSYDNVGGLYNRYVENKLAALITEGHRFILKEIKDADPRLTVDEYEKQPETIKSIGERNKVDSFVVAKILKNKKNISIRLDLYLVSDGLLFTTEQVDNESRFEITDVEKKIAELFSRAIAKIPYKGLVLSRQSQRVTLDLGTLDGIKENAILTVEQVLSIKRHPKFGFILSSEKEIIGKIKIIKSEPKLSFAVILQEKEKGVIAKDSKVSGLDFVTYADPTKVGDPNTPQDQVSFGKNPREWKPETDPSLGVVGIGLAITNFRYATSLLTAGSFTGSAPIVPQIDVHGEMWITRNWYVGASMQQGVFSMGNPLNGSSPGTINATMGHYDLHAGYKFLLQDEFWGPQIYLEGGFSKYSLFVDASSPLAFTSTSYSGLLFGIGGTVPIDEERLWALDAKLAKVLFPVLSETPVSSGGASDNSITLLGIGGSYKLNTRFRARGMMNFEFYSSTFSGAGSRSDSGQNASQSLITLIGGLDYYF